MTTRGASKVSTTSTTVRVIKSVLGDDVTSDVSYCCDVCLSKIMNTPIHVIFVAVKTLEDIVL
jgi:hypothetical protein